MELLNMCQAVAGTPDECVVPKRFIRYTLLTREIITRPLNNYRGIWADISHYMYREYYCKILKYYYIDIGNIMSPTKGASITQV